MIGFQSVTTSDCKPPLRLLNGEIIQPCMREGGGRLKKLIISRKVRDPLFMELNGNT